MITQQELKEHLHYNPETGFFRWEKPTANWIKAGQVAGRRTDQGYINICFCGHRHFAHRLAYLYMEGYIPENEVDHINRNRADNRWSNLREVSRQCNMRNASMPCNNTSGITGVSFHKVSQKWQSHITVNEKLKHLGLFADFDEAVAHRFAAEQCLGWKGCNSTSPAYLHMEKTRNIKR